MPSFADGLNVEGAVEYGDEQTGLVACRSMPHRLTGREMTVRAWADHRVVDLKSAFENNDGVGSGVSMSRKFQAIHSVQFGAWSRSVCWGSSRSSAMAAPPRRSAPGGGIAVIEDPPRSIERTETEDNMRLEHLLDFKSGADDKSGVGLR